MADYIAYFNGEWMPFSRVKRDPDDRVGVGDVVFDSMRTFDGKIYKLKEHVDRLYRSLRYVRIDPGLSPEEMTEASEETIRRNEHLRAEVGDFQLMPIVTRGPGLRAWNATQPSVTIKASPLPFFWFAHAYTGGMHAAIARTRSYPAEALDPKVKHFSRMNFHLAELEANDLDPGAWPILMDIDGNITEGAGYNVLIVSNGVIRSPTDRAILQGVSMGAMSELARQLDIPVVEEDLQPYHLYSADEVFFTSSSYCLLPVTYVDRREIADGKPGPITQQLLAAWSETVGVDIVDQAVQFARK